MIKWFKKIFSAPSDELDTVEDSLDCIQPDYDDGYDELVKEVISEATAFDDQVRHSTTQLLEAGQKLLDCLPIFTEKYGRYEDHPDAPANWKYHIFKFNGILFVYCVCMGNYSPFAVAYNAETQIAVFDTRETTPNKKFLTEKVLAEYVDIITNKADAVFKETEERLLLNVTNQSETIYTNEQDSSHDKGEEK